MNLKKVSKILSEVRDNARKDGKLSEDDKDALKTLVNETIANAQNDLKKLPKKVKNHPMPQIPTPENDNTALTTEQKFRLRLMEKTGTGSVSIH